MPSKDFNLEVGNVIDQVSVDVCGPFVVTRDGNTVLLVAVDDFSRWVEAYALPDQTAETCARVLYDNLFTRFDCCHVLRSDNGPNFASDLFRELCMLFNIKKTFTSPFHPAGNSFCKCFNKTILAALRPKLVEGLQDRPDWDQLIPGILMAYRATAYSTTKQTPKMMPMGREVCLPTLLMKGEIINDMPASQYLCDFVTRLHTHRGKELKKRKLSLEFSSPTSHFLLQFLCLHG